MTTQDIVQKLWSLCHILRDDGITYHEYVTELTYLLFLKMAKETETETQLPKGHRWDDVVRECVFRPHLGTRSGVTWAPVPETWARVPEHLGTRSGTLGRPFRHTWAAVPAHPGGDRAHT